MKKTYCFCLLFLLLPFQFLLAQSQVILDGYTNKQSYMPGDTMTVFANGFVPMPNSRIYLYTVTNTKADSVQTVLLPQVVSQANPSQTGFGYLPTFTYIIPQLPSGIYNWDHKVYFIVKNPTRNAAITVVYPTNTDAAYNNSGGLNFYGSNKIHTVSFKRPLSGQIINTNYHEASGFLRWIKLQQTYDVQVISDMDMDTYTEIAASQVVVLIGHSEYWTRQARQNFDQFVNSGKSALVLSGNTMWWQVRYNADKTKLICYKDSTADPEPNPLLKTITWNKPSLQYAIINSIGADWAHGAYGRKTVGFGGFKIINPNSPLLSGTNLGLGDTLKLSTIEYDGTLISGINNLGYPVLDTAGLGFYRAELIGYDIGQNNINPPTGYGTFIAFQKTPASGRIINAASMNWCDQHAGIGSGPHAARLSTITRNMLNKLLLNQPIFTNSSQLAIGSSPELEDAITVYPNPGSGRFTLNLTKLTKEPVQLVVFNETGAMVLSETLTFENGYNFDITGLPDGTYAYQVYSQNSMLLNGQLILMR